MNSGDPSNYALAERILADLLAQTPRDTPDYASSNHQLAKLYQRMNRLDLAKKYYTISAITDIRCAIKETSALQNSALIYFDAGDEKRLSNMPSLPSRMPYSAVRRFVPRKWRSFIRWSTPHFAIKRPLQNTTFSGRYYSSVCCPYLLFCLSLRSSNR